MKTETLRAAATRVAATVTALACVALTAHSAHAQDRLKSMPGYAEYQKAAAARASLGMGGRGGGGAITWSADSKSVDFESNGDRLRMTVASRTIEPATENATSQAGGRGRGGFGNQPARGRQFDNAVAPAGNHRAIYKDRNVWIADSSGANPVQITTDGSDKTRIKYGTASWVYGEELSQTTAMWWSPDGKKLAFYRFDESKIPDFYLATNLTHIQDTIDVEAYPKPGVPNPVVDLYVYDVDSKKTTRVDVRDGKPLENSVVGYYVFRIAWSPDGKELTFLRANRRQNTMEMAACNPASGACRVVLHEENPTGWIDDDPAPSVTWLADGNRFIWDSDRSGFKNYYLYDFKAAKLIAPLTQLPAEVSSIVRVDEPAGMLYYMARDGDNYMKFQLHRVGLDGKHDVRLTDPAFTHTISLAPDEKYFVDVAETHDQPPVTRLMDATGKVVKELATTDMSRFNALGLKKVELYTYKTTDGRATLHGEISFPTNFDPSKKYPVLVSVYGGPAVGNSTSERFAVPSVTAEYGFIVLQVEARTNPGMGRRYLDDVYLKLGQVEQDDMADGVKALFDRPYIDRNRVGVYGTSYGGYTSVMEILRHPEVFAAASASSPPTDWRNYDTIYTERYMWIPQENKEGYDKGSAMTYADSLRGRLMLYYGSADNNVHPSNMMQLIQALQHAGKSFEVQVGPDQGHSGLNNQRMMEFFIENLVMDPARLKA
ncbi:MAG TPA: DPP IV N-terminal domain-containing protein [Gemmatimonadaceae bacterium]|jgi:dipeptidyl-peptidase-4